MKRENNKLINVEPCVCVEGGVEEKNNNKFIINKCRTVCVCVGGGGGGGEAHRGSGWGDL